MAEAPTEAQLNYLGEVFARSVYVNVTLSYISIGMQLFMCAYGLAAFFELSRDKRQGRLPFIIASFAIFFFSTWTVAIESYLDFTVLFYGGTTGLGYIEAQTKMASDFGRSWQMISKTSAMLTYVAIGECLLLYRCFIIWRDRWIIVLLPGLTCLCSLAAGIMTVYPLASTKRIPGSVWMFTSVAANVMITALLVFRLTRAQRRIPRDMPIAHRLTTMYSWINALLIESAAPLACFGIGSAILTALGQTGNRKWDSAMPSMLAGRIALQLLYFSFCAISPQMIIFRVATGCSWTTLRGHDAATDFPESMEFTTPGGARSLASDKDSSAVDSYTSQNERAAG